MPKEQFTKMLKILALCIAIAAVVLIVMRVPINGWGSLFWLLATVLITVIRAPFAKQTRNNIITEKRAVNTERLLLALVMIGGTFLPLLHLTTGLLAFANYTMPHWLTAIGVLLLIPGFWLFWRSHADLGQNWSVTTEIREDHTLITQGVYRHIRHPMYTAIWILFLAYPLLIHNWIAGPAVVLAFGIMYVVRVPVEEIMMRDQFGAAYDEYCQRTGRLWPKLS